MVSLVEFRPGGDRAGMVRPLSLANGARFSLRQGVRLSERVALQAMNERTMMT